MKKTEKKRLMQKYETNGLQIISLMLIVMLAVASASLLFSGIVEGKTSNVHIPPNYNYPPNIITEPLTNIEEDSEYYVDYDAVDMNYKDQLRWLLDTNADWLEIDESTGELEGTPNNNDVGIYDVDLQVFDGHGAHDTVRYHLTVVNTDPQITTKDVINVYEDSYYYVDYESDEDGQGSISWGLVNDLGWLSIDRATGRLTGIPDNSNVGTYEVSVFVQDGHGGIDYSNFNLTVNNVDPTIITENVIQADISSIYYVDYSSDDDGEGMTHWYIKTDASWLNIESDLGILYGIPDDVKLGDQFSVDVLVIDGNGGRDVTSFTLEIVNLQPYSSHPIEGNINTPPDITAPPVITDNPDVQFDGNINTPPVITAPPVITDNPDVQFDGNPVIPEPPIDLSPY